MATTNKAWENRLQIKCFKIFFNFVYKPKDFFFVKKKNIWSEG